MMVSPTLPPAGIIGRTFSSQFYQAMEPNQAVFIEQSKMIKEMAEKSDCVIVGRCADYVLKDNPDVIRLFFYAPLEDCIRRVVDQNGISAKEAEKKIAKIDKYRADYYKYYTGNAWNDARNYDFCLDTSSMSYEKLVAVVKDIIKIYQE